MSNPSPGGPGSVRASNFTLVGATRLSLQSFRVSRFTLSKVRICHESLNKELLRVISQEAIYRQLVPGNLQKENRFTFKFSHYILWNQTTLFETLLMCYQSGPVARTAVGGLQVASCDMPLVAPQLVWFLLE